MNWGPWFLNKETLELALLLPPTFHPEKEPQWTYGIDLERIDSSAAVLDWLCQVSLKDWATPEIIGYLLLALDEIFRFQSTLCSGGVEKRGFDCFRTLNKFMKDTREVA